MAVLLYTLTFIGFVLVSGVSTGSNSNSYAESRAVAESGSSYASSSATSSSYSGQDTNCKPSKPKCKKNEKETSCINSVCEYRNCSDIGKPIKCVRLDPRKCIRGCICENEYLRNDSTGLCIPKDHCPILCPPARCNVDERVYDCAPNPKPGDAKCKPGCRCIDNYKKNESGICIPKEECPKKCGVNEIFDICPPLCPPARCDVDERLVDCAPNPKPGDAKCKPGCRCIDNYKKNDSGICIPKEECLTCDGENEVVGCKTSCPETCESIGKNCTIIEPAVCVPACRCKPGFYRDKVGNCISKKKCSYQCGLNEIYYTCLPICPPPRCDVDEKSIQCLRNPEPGDPTCKSGCRCIENYKKNKDGVCIPKEECPPIPPIACRDDEEYFECANGGCGRWKCSQASEICIDLVQGGCIEGCRCKKPLLRAEDESCVPADQCPLICTGQNEIVGCHTACPETCDSIGKNCTIIESKICKPECRCKNGFYRNKDGDCISKKECPKECGVNEIYDICPPTCPPQRCDVDERVIRCAKNPKPGDAACKPGCRCLDNYKKNKYGVCVPKKECFTCNGQNEVVGCKTSRPETCESIGQKGVALVEPAVCKPACRCKTGFYRNKIGNCISKKQCLQCTGPNEYFSCGSACDNVCATLSKQNQTNCLIKNIVCNQKCYCDENYARDSNNICIPIEECPPECGDNEIYDICPPTCPPQRCDVDETTILCLPNPKPGDSNCKPGCRCIDNYKKNKSGVCIPKEECPTCKGINEILGCRTACPETCDSIGKNCTIIEPAVCIPECRCKPGHYRNELGDCISKKECRTKCNVNEIYDICPPTCPPPRCDVDERVIRCAKNPEPGDPACKPGCRCLDNHKKNEYGVCIPKEKCPGYISCGPNEILSSCVNGGCGRWNCSQPSEICYKIADSACREGCRCIDSYLRADNGTCIPADQCPPLPVVICRDDEEYMECANGGCGRWECWQQGEICIDFFQGGCIAGCRCKEPLLRTDDGSCVTADQCPPICTGQNEIVGCRTACPETCESIGKNCTIIEPAVCTPACRCQPGFYRNKNEECVPEKQCTTPVVCRSDEVYSDCANGGCGRWECSQQGQICIDLVEGGCRGGCRCKEPLLRAEDGSCVSADQCPPICTGQNEVVGCRTACPETCDSIDKNCTIIEAAVCIPACRCQPGFYRNEIGHCISKEQCLKCSGPNEFFSCGPACDNVCDKLSTENQTNCLYQNIVCNEMCYCLGNYARDNFDTCIPIEECPSKENGIKKFTDGNIIFTEKFLRVGSKINSGVSAVYSPFSLLFLLAPLALYTKGASEQQLLNALNLPSRSLLRSTIPLYLDEFYSQRNVSLDLAARVYVNVKYKISKAFAEDTKNLIKAEAQNLDFSKPVQAAKIINDWVELITNDLIQNLVSPDSLSENTRLVLVNAIYFLGDWQTPFKKEKTRKQDFYVNQNKNVTVDMMNQIGYFKYAELNKPNIQVLELPYANRNLSFVVCLPKSKDGIDEFIDALGDPSFSIVQTAIKSLKSRRVDVSIPLMKITTTTDLGDVLPKLNVSAIFNPKTANFSGILEKSEKLFVSSATQKATIIVTETGTQAAAANAIIIGVTSVLLPDEVTYFKADHPFAFFIVYNGTPLFCGIYRVINIRMSAAVPMEATKFNANHPYAYFIMYEGTPIFCGIYMGS